MSRRDLPRLHLVTDDEVLAGAAFVERAREALAAGGSRVALHLRGPGSSGRRLHALARELGEVTRETGSPLLANDRVDVALAAGLDGVHLPERGLPAEPARSLLGPGAWLGASVHGPEAAGTARDGGVDFLVVGTVFATSSHPGREPAGPEILREVGAEVHLPLLAIGGVSPQRVAATLDAGAWGVAVLSGVWSRDAPGDAVREYLSALDGGGGGQPR